MTEWQVWFDFAHALSSDRIEDLLIGPLAPYHACGSGGDGCTTSGFVMTVEAETAAAALDVAWQVVTQAEPAIMPNVWGSEKSGATQAALNSAFRFFGFADDDKNATKKLDLFIERFKADEKRALADLVGEAYRDATSKIDDLNSATLGQLRDAFKAAYAIDKDVLKKAVRFFVYAMTDSGMTLSPYITNTARGIGRTMLRLRGRTRRVRTLAAPVAAGAPTPPSEEESVEMLSDLRREYVKTLMEKAFADGQANAELLDRIERLLGYDDSESK